MSSQHQVSRKDITRQTKPILCYAVENLPAKKGGDELYAALRTAVKDGKATLVEKLEIPAKDARSWKVPAGHMWRIVCTHGPQVADMNIVGRYPIRKNDSIRLKLDKFMRRI